MDDANGLDGKREEGDEHTVVLKMLTSEDWQKRLEEARQSREKILAKKPAARPIVLKAPTRGERTASGATNFDDTFEEEDEDAEDFPDPLPPTPVFRRPSEPVGDTEPRSKAADRVVSLTLAPRPRAADSLPELVAPAAVEVTPQTVAPPRKGIGLRLFGGFAIGLVAGGAVASLVWMNRPAPAPVTELAAAAPSPTEPAVVAVKPPATALPAEPVRAAAEPAADAPSAVDDLAGASALAAPGAETEAAPTMGTAPDGPMAGAAPVSLPEPETELAAVAPDAVGLVEVSALPDSVGLMDVATTEPLAPLPGADVAIATRQPMTMPAPDATASPVTFIRDAAPTLPVADSRAVSMPAPDGDDAAEVPGVVLAALTPTDVPLGGFAAQDAAPTAVAPPPPPVLAPAASPRPVAPSLPELDVAAPASALTVKILAPTNLADAEVDATQGRLGTAGYLLTDAARVGVTVSDTHVRYYHEGDRAGAEALASAFDGTARDFTRSSDQTPPGTVELWLEGSAPKAAKANAGKSKPKVSGSRKVQAKKPPAEDPQVRALRERLLGKLKNMNKS